MNTIHLNLTTLPNEDKMGIIQHLDLPSLATLGRTDRLFKILTDRLLPNIIKAIQCPPSQGSPIQQIKSHVEELYAKADKLKDDRIQHLLTQPKTLENVKLLQKFLKARDTLILWHYLLPNNAPQLDQLLTCNDVIENADAFSDAFNQHKQQLISTINYLNFNKRNLTHIPSQIFELSNLLRLDLNKNMLTEIPDEIRNLTNLETLDLRKNSLKTLPSQIAALNMLKDLLLSHNKLKSVSLGMTGLTKLRDLYLHDNQLSSLPNGFDQITCRILDIRDNLFPSLPLFPNVAYLNCDSNLRPLTTRTVRVLNHNSNAIIAVGKAITAIAAVGLAYYNIGLICPSLFN